MGAARKPVLAELSMEFGNLHSDKKCQTRKPKSNA
jgi:hypothetical protein